MPPLPDVQLYLGPSTVVEVPIPHDCVDGFLGAKWRHPEAYLTPEVRGAISSFSRISNVDAGVAALRRDLESGDWHERFGALLDRPTLDLGYRLVITG